MKRVIPNFSHLRDMDILLVIQDASSINGSDLHLVPLDVMHVVLVDAELRAGEGDARHLVLQGGDVERSGDHVVEEQLQTELELMM